ncbi:MAG: hypothetical protein M1822_010193 [Bathelium mastoideum]|nr:MAG: hypothetical protein M1822_010193 [Bathelium mastoideum]
MSQEKVPLPVPDVPLNFVPAKTGEVLTIGPAKLRVMEDGSNTDNRLGAAELILAPHQAGPPAHWHEMHDETFLVTKGTVRFHVPITPSNPTEKTIDAQEGDYVTVPIRSPHTFSNPTGGEARFFNTFTPAFYINYFKLLSMLQEEAGELTPEINKKAMAAYATLPIPG